MALEEAVDSASVGLQMIQQLAGLQELDSARAVFPRGYIRTTAVAKKLFPFIDRPVLQTNLAYAVQLSDVLTWILTRTDLGSIARDMVVKTFLALAGGIVDAVATNHYHGQRGWRQNYRTRAERLQSEGVIDAATAAEMIWLWEMRCRQHVFEIDASEFYAYSREDHPRARAVVNAVVQALAGAAGQSVSGRPF